MIVWILRFDLNDDCRWTVSSAFMIQISSLAAAQPSWIKVLFSSVAWKFGQLTVLMSTAILHIPCVSWGHALQKLNCWTGLYKAAPPQKDGRAGLFADGGPFSGILCTSQLFCLGINIVWRPPVWRDRLLLFEDNFSLAQGWPLWTIPM